MDKLTPIGRIFIGIALCAFGVQQFIFGDFVPGRAPAWPDVLPGRLVWAYFSGMVFIITGTAIISGKKARPAAILAGTIILVWALLRHIVALAADFQYGGELTMAGKALALFGGAYAVAGSLPSEESSRSGLLGWLLQARDEFIVLGRWCLGIFLALCGVQHFLFVEFVASLVPTWIPGAVFWTYFAGVALIAGGVGLLIPQTAWLAGTLSGLMIFTWFVILHIPRAVAATGDGNEWIAVFEALAMSGIAFVVAGFLHEREREAPYKPNSEKTAVPG